MYVRRTAFLTTGLLSGGARADLPSHGPWQQFADAIDGMIGDARNDVAQVGLGRDRSAWLPQPTINYRARASIESRAHAHMRLVLGALRTVRRPVLERLLTHCHHLDIRLVLATLAGQLDAPWAQWVERHLAARPLSAP